MQWHTQAGNITNSLKIDADFNLPGISVTNVVTWRCHVDDSANVRYDMIVVRYLLT